MSPSQIPASNDAATPASGQRLLGIDFGARKLGLAVSDALGLTAQGLPTLLRTNKRQDLDAIAAILAEHQVTAIVMGLPLHMSGQAGAGAARVEAFAEVLRERFNLPVHLWDERLTSAQANRLLRETDMSIRRRGQVVDRVAAVLILQSFLDSRSA